MKIFFVFGNLEIDSTFVLEDYIRSFTFVNRCFCQITFPLRALSRVSTGSAGSWAPRLQVAETGRLWLRGLRVENLLDTVQLKS